ncbi:DNA internalization-related competence protein ComEC/Rec2 [Paenibacillus sp. YN15]|uniref:DNA internalization-related competence protein ComEC/Rec2 n=1 Tax=Paenibacillus sp. YN15 TaxID=1742774 RepID=UPI0015ECC4F6|nr:DNA internalization-related competence protein ComEC/Rec2 [Paenibacillus sp. YN15]
MSRTAIQTAAVFAAGAGLAAAGYRPLFWGWAVIAAIWMLAVLAGRRKTAMQVLWLSAALLAGNSYYAWADARLSSSVVSPSTGWNAAADEAGAELAGRLDTPVEVDGDRAVFYVRTEEWIWTDGEAVRAGGELVYVTVRLQEQPEQKVAAGWRRGDRIRLTGTVKMPEPARNFGGFDFREYLRKKDVHWMVTVKGASAIELSPPGKWDAARLLRWNDSLREGAGSRLAELFPGEEAGYMKGLLIGIREDLDPERFRNFSRLGLTHILAISGLHVGVFLWAVTALCRRLGVTKEMAARIGFWTIPLYVVFTGSSPSVVRSGLTAMAGLYAAGKGWLKDGLSLLALALLGMLVWNPLYITDVGFQLSFLVTAGLLAGVPAITRLIPGIHPLWKSSLSVALTAQLVSFPISVYYFNQFSLLSLPANLLLVPLISFVVTPLGYGVLLLSFVWPWAAKAAAVLVSLLNRFTFYTIDLSERLPSMHLSWPTPSFLWIAAYYMLLVWLVLQAGVLKQHGELNRQRIFLVPDGAGFRRRCIRMTVLASALWTGCLLYGYAPTLFTERGMGTVSFLDVGQGDCAWVRTSEGKHILIDGGGTISFRKAGEEWKERQDPFEVGRKTVVPLLKKRGVHKLDTLIISHQDTDHIGGLQAVLEEIPVGRILFNGTLKSSPGAVKLFQTAVSLGIPLIPVQQGDEFTTGKSAVWKVLAPLPEEGGTQVRLLEEQNDESVVMLLTMKGRRFLFTGDIGENQERRLLDELSDAGNASPLDVMKIAHHGSRYSSSGDWLWYWSPRLAVISAGKNNVYGHPSPYALERLTESGAGVYRTDRQGEVEFSVRDEGLFVRTKLAEGHGK